jgi:general stress protein 26
MPSPTSQRRKVRELIRHAGVAMPSPPTRHGTHFGRPMLPMLLDNDSHIYFLTQQKSRKVNQIAARPKIGLTMISGNCYLVVAGSANASSDVKLIRRLRCAFSSSVADVSYWSMRA